MKKGKGEVLFAFFAFLIQEKNLVKFYKSLLC